MSQHFLFPLLLILFCMSIGIGYVFLCWRSHRVPNGPFNLSDFTHPLRNLAQSKRVVVLGDSLTHGTMSHPWLQNLQVTFKGKLSFINAGMNGDLAWNALQKVDQISAIEPDIVAVFIGGNDVLASLSPAWATSFIERKDLPYPPTSDWYRDNLEKIITKLQSNTDARLVLFTLTLFGEDLSSLENKRMRFYSQIVHETAAKLRVDVIPIHQNLRSRLTTRQKRASIKPIPATDYAEYRKLMRGALIRHHFLFQSWDKISKARGYLTQTDGVHLNSQAAGIISAAFSDWLKKTISSDPPASP